MFYLMVAAGGALGGVLVALVAPLFFNYYEEFELGIIGCGLLVLFVHYFDEASPLHRGQPRMAWAILLVTVLGLSYSLLDNVHEKRTKFTYAARDFYGRDA